MEQKAQSKFRVAEENVAETPVEAAEQEAKAVLNYVEALLIDPSFDYSTVAPIRYPASVLTVRMLIRIYSETKSPQFIGLIACLLPALSTTSVDGSHKRILALRNHIARLKGVYDSKLGLAKMLKDASLYRYCYQEVQLWLDSSYTTEPPLENKHCKCCRPTTPEGRALLDTKVAAWKKANEDEKADRKARELVRLERRAELETKRLTAYNAEEQAACVLAHMNAVLADSSFDYRLSNVSFVAS
jgi:hypothetical protein